MTELNMNEVVERELAQILAGQEIVPLSAIVDRIVGKHPQFAPDQVRQAIRAALKPSHTPEDARQHAQELRRYVSQRFSGTA